jgi:multisubunit Na+/H+ antiporter MnhF subunit
VYQGAAPNNTRSSCVVVEGVHFGLRIGFFFCMLSVVLQPFDRYRLLAVSSCVVPLIVLAVIVHGLPALSFFVDIACPSTLN